MLLQLAKIYEFNAHTPHHQKLAVTTKIDFIYFPIYIYIYIYIGWYLEESRRHQDI
jgi:hypothetical protein